MSKLDLLVGKINMVKPCYKDMIRELAYIKVFCMIFMVEWPT